MAGSCASTRLRTSPALAVADVRVAVAAASAETAVEAAEVADATAGKQLPLIA
jgi:hypothetical protein